MEKLENLTIEQLAAARKDAENEGFTETQTIESVEIGKLSGTPVIVKGKNNSKSASFTLIKFDRTNKQGETIKLFFEACKFNMKHLTTGKSYNDVNVKVTDELKAKYAKPENLSKEAMLESVAYKDGQGRERTIVKLLSIAK